MRQKRPGFDSAGMKAVLGALVHSLADLNKTHREVRVNKTIAYHNKICSWVFMVGYLSV